MELVDTDGPFLALPALKRVWPQGMPRPDAGAVAALKDAKPAFEKAWEDWDVRRDDQATLELYRKERDVWVETVLRDVFGWGESYRADSTAEVRSPDHSVTVRAGGELVREEAVGALVLVVDPVESLRDPLDDGWAASPVDRMEELLRSSGVPIGVVTDGRWWAIVSARRETMAASGIVDAQTWIEEAQTRDAVIALLQRRRLVGGKPEDRLTELFGESVAAAEEITEALGTQVRRAVELLVQALSEAALSAEDDPLPEDRGQVYEAAVTVMMRVVFLLFAEERGLLPQGELFSLGYGISEELDALDTRVREESAEALDNTYLTWHRLLATSLALYQGASFEDVRLPSYGGSLFDPGRFPFLTARGRSGGLAITVSDRVMLEVLRAVQVAKIKGQPARRISFRDIDVEQIGYIYEGLLGYSCAEVDEVMVGLIGKEGEEPEIPLAVLESLAETKHTDTALAEALLAWAKENQPAATPPSKAALVKAIRESSQVEDAERALRAVTTDEKLRGRLRPFVGIIRRDLRNRPLVVLPGGVLVVETPSRASAGAHYTPKSLAEEVVLHALEPLVYDPGPHQMADRDAWVPVSSDRILDLKIADIACGSGAFLVAAARYLAARLVEAWRREGVAIGTPHDQQTHAIRTVVANCLYGADINGMAVEMCKLSLWLVSLDARLPFSFVDDKILHGNSLLGITDVQQLKFQHIDPDSVRQMPLFQPAVDGVLSRAVRLREKLASEVDNVDPQRSVTTKRRQWGEYRELVARLNEIGDAVIAAGLRHGGKPGKKLNVEYENLRQALSDAYAPDGDRAMLDSVLEAGLTPTEHTDYDRWKPLHWPVMVPDVMARGGFDAVVGNPAFLHSKKITTAYGKNYRDYLRNVLAKGVAGDADLAAYFLLRQFELLSGDGGIGIVVTKSIIQSHTKEVGLDQALASGATLTEVSNTFDWGSSGASVSVIKIWLTKSAATYGRKPLVGDPVRPVGRPVRSYVGTYPNGDGFRVPADRAREWLTRYPDLQSSLIPYIRAVDLSMGDPKSPEEFLIDLHGLPEDEARRTGPLWQHLERTQRLWREKPTTKGKRDRWWDFERSADALYRELRETDSAIAIPRTSNLLMPRRIPASSRVDMGVVVFPTSDWSVYAQIASSLHYHWTLSYGATTRDDPSYAPRRLTDTFPWILAGSNIEAVKEFEAALEKNCQTMGGLRPVMNSFNDKGNHDSAISTLRELFIELDSETLSMFGWSDVKPVYDFHVRNNLMRFTVDSASRDEILYRLLEENYHRAAQGEASSSAEDVKDDE
ncbi:DUF4192 domain-containing protein [Amycolatopsis rifamycinica]|uniref:DUF4192 domain-containing protein n=1 Tax=Amycolatopsis rifamycinica TaxID=287986 RepID=UPI000A96C66F|nr:DUF4192 domain-containing protein [Amycolatopsis rifamycinica]